MQCFTGFVICTTQVWRADQKTVECEELQGPCEPPRDVAGGCALQQEEVSDHRAGCRQEINSIYHCGKVGSTKTLFLIILLVEPTRHH